MIPIQNSVGYIIAKERGWVSLITKGGPGSGIRGHVTAREVGTSKSKTALDKISSILGDQLHVTEKDSAIVKQYIDDLSMFSGSILNALKDKGVSFYIGDKPMIDLDDNQFLKGVRPRGWPEGSTWDSVAGGYNLERKIVSVGRGRSGSLSLIGHETGHAILRNLIKEDRYGNRMDILKDLHEKYYSTFTSYYSQGGLKSDVGVSEMFAESVGALIGQSKNLYSESFYRINSNKDFTKDATNLIKKWGIV